MPTVVERVEAECDTELSRLGSEKLLLAATEADVTDDTVAGVLVATLESAADRLEAWADGADDAVADRLGAAATNYRSIAAATREAWPEAAGEPLVTLETPDAGWARVGAGLVGLGLVLDRLCLQAISYHVNEANAGAADRFREVRDDVASVRDRAADPADEAARDAAVAGGVAVVAAAYERYASRLEAMGLDPKPLC